jgi:hypothetical protein
MKEAANTSETSVNFCQTTRCNNREGSHLHTRRRENPKSNPIHLFRMLLPKNKPHCFNQTWFDRILYYCLRSFTFSSLKSNLTGCFKNRFICLIKLTSWIQTRAFQLVLRFLQYSTSLLTNSSWILWKWSFSWLGFVLCAVSTVVGANLCARDSLEVKCKGIGGCEGSQIRKHILSIR